MSSQNEYPRDATVTPLPWETPEYMTVREGVLSTTHSIERLNAYLYQSRNWYVDVLQKHIATQTLQNEELVKEVQTGRESNRQLKEQLQGQVDNSRKLALELLAERDSNAELRQMVQDLLAMNEDATAESSDAGKQTVATDSKKTIVRSSACAPNDAVESISARLRAEYIVKIESANLRIKELEEALGASEHAAAEKIESLQAALGASEHAAAEKIESLQAALSASEHAAAEKIGAFREALIGSEKLVDLQVKRIESLQEALDAAKVAASQTDRTTGNTQKVDKATATSPDDAATDKAAAAKTTAAANTSLKDKLAAQEGKLAALKEQLSLSKQSVTVLTKDCKSKEARVKELTQKVQALEATVSSQKERADKVEELARQGLRRRQAAQAAAGTGPAVPEEVQALRMELGSAKAALSAARIMNRAMLFADDVYDSANDSYDTEDTFAGLF